MTSPVADYAAIARELVVCPACDHGNPHVRPPSNLCTAVFRDAGGSSVYCNCPCVFPPDDDLPCCCHGCCSRYKVDVQISDDLWEQVTRPFSPRPEMLCSICIMKRIEQLDKYARYRLVEEQSHETTEQGT